VFFGGPELTSDVQRRTDIATTNEADRTSTQLRRTAARPAGEVIGRILHTPAAPEARPWMGHLAAPPDRAADRRPPAQIPIRRDTPSFVRSNHCGHGRGHARQYRRDVVTHARLAGSQSASRAWLWPPALSDSIYSRGRMPDRARNCCFDGRSTRPLPDAHCEEAHRTRAAEYLIAINQKINRSRPH
jgi:hypothetical protein